jgi:hypothetical protein
VISVLVKKYCFIVKMLDLQKNPNTQCFRQTLIKGRYVERKEKELRNIWQRGAKLKKKIKYHNILNFSLSFTSSSPTRFPRTATLSPSGSRYPFHQNFTSRFFVQKCFAQLFYAYSLGLWFFVQRNSVKKKLV